MSSARFERVVTETLKTIPEDLRALLDNVTISIEDAPTDQELLDAGLDPQEETLFGLYQGVPWGERGWEYGGQLPDRIVIYRQPLLEECSSLDELAREIRLTVIHEIGHYFGLDEDRLP